MITENEHWVDRIERWWRAQGNRVPLEGTEEYGAMIAIWCDLHGMDDPAEEAPARVPREEEGD